MTLRPLEFNNLNFPGPRICGINCPVRRGLAYSARRRPGGGGGGRPGACARAGERRHRQATCPPWAAWSRSRSSYS